MIAENGIVKEIRDEVEFYTVQATGESGMSISGLARLCGVGQDAICKLKEKVMTSSCPEFLKPLQGIDLALMSSVNEFNNATILKAEVCGMFLEWYAFESQRTNDIAKKYFRQFSRMGINAWIQEITGWQPQNNKSKLELIAEALLQIDKVEKDQELMKQQMALEAQRVSELEKVVEQHDCELDRIFKPDGEYYTVRGYASKIGFKNLGLTKAKAIGGEASKYCRANNIPMDKMTDPRYGTVNCYPEKVLERFF